MVHEWVSRSEADKSGVAVGIQAVSVLSSFNTRFLWANKSFNVLETYVGNWGGGGADSSASQWEEMLWDWMIFLPEGARNDRKEGDLKPNPVEPHVKYVQVWRTSCQNSEASVRNV